MLNYNVAELRHNKKGTSKNTLVFFTLRITFLFNNLSF